MYRSCSFGKQCEFVELRDMQHGYFTEGDRCACGNFTTILSWILYRGVQVRMRKLYHNVDLDILQRVTGAHAQTLPQYWHGYFTEGDSYTCANFTAILSFTEGNRCKLYHNIDLDTSQRATCAHAKFL